jgi:hypothetical protein
LDGELMVFGPLQNEDLDQQVRDLREVVVASGARLGRSPADSLSFRPAVQLGYP